MSAPARVGHEGTSGHGILSGSRQYAFGLHFHCLDLILFNGLVDLNDGASFEFSLFCVQIHALNSRLLFYPRSVQGSDRYY